MKTIVRVRDEKDSVKEHVFEHIQDVGMTPQGMLVLHNLGKALVAMFPAPAVVSVVCPEHDTNLSLLR